MTDARFVAGRCATHGRHAALLGLLLLPKAALTAQAPAETAPAAWDVAPYLGVALHSPVSDDWGMTPDRNHLFVGIHLRTPVLRVGRFQLSYAPTLTPLLRLSHDRPAGSSDPRAPTAYGIGLAPFGLAVGVPLGFSLRAYGSTAVGGLWFNRVVPVPDARAFNVTIEWGGYLEWSRGPSSGIQVGYKYHHLSNVYTAPANPGVDANVVFVGHRWRFAVRR